MKKILYFIIAVIVSGCSNNDLIFYRSDIDKATNKCDGEIYLKFVFKVDVDTQKVMKVTYFIDNENFFKSESLQTTKFLEDCKVLDARNFVCGGKWDYTINYRDSAWSVTDGVIHYEVGRWGSKSDGSEWLGRCWYKDSFFVRKLISE